MREQKKIVVTGCSGFIGSHLCESLIQKGDIVIGFDDHSKGSMKNMKNFIDDSNFFFHNIDISDIKEFSLHTVGVTEIYHLADESDIEFALSHPESYFQTNPKSLFSVLNAMKVNNIKRIFFPSSTTVFGSGAVIPTPEDFGPLKPESLYGASKLAAEGFLNAWCSAYEITAVIFRFASVIGGRQDHGVVHDFTKRLVEDSTELRVKGNGSALRSFVFIDDCVDIFIKYFNSIKKPGTDIVHLGNNDVISVKEVAEVVCDAFELNKEIISYEKKSLGWIGDSKSNEIECKKIESLGLMPRNTSQEAVKKSVQRLRLQFEEI